MASTKSPPIFSLPNEIVLNVFSYLAANKVAADYTPSKLRFPLPITRVCRAWHDLAISSPSLWTTVLIQGDTDVSVAALFVKRADPCTFSLHVHSQDLHRGKVDKILSILASGSSRLRAFKVTSFIDAEIDLYTGILSGLSCSALESVDFRSQTGATSGVEVFSCITQSSSLRSVTLKGQLYGHRLSASWHNLTFMNLRKMQPTHAYFVELFTSAPRLEILYLPSLMVNPDEGADMNRSSIQAPSLRVLSVGLPRDHAEQNCSCPLSFLRMPHLKSLCISGKEIPNIGFHFFRSGAEDSLITLRLHNIAIDSEDAAFYQKFHNVRRMELVSVTGDVSTLFQSPIPADRASESRPTTLPFPRLSSIAYFPISPYPIQWLEDVACRRVSDDQRLLVELQKSSYDDYFHGQPSQFNMTLHDQAPGPDFPLDEDDPFDWDSENDWGSEDSFGDEVDSEIYWYDSGDEEWYEEGEDEFGDDDGLEDIMGPLS
ncbi:hypothetical protein Moror_17189 [Moniliophthora roreri MCA 2997]|uniref:F-box domain-containing protein n=1 Tax=Moniliophthora roreri (strain MCA 2997) TaxID=1381753 RepID=V2XVW3_MONRO|nr:hypothetical protein Moror_17189 [Moniliophthora roreri MCA 2997]